jgi:ribose/xylose/arabinose/galactoside ABC-type transport system permease subunit
MTLSAYVALIVIGGHDSRLALGVAAAMALGLLVGPINTTLVLLARIPAIIATLATDYILATASLLANRAIPASQSHHPGLIANAPWPAALQPYWPAARLRSTWR